MTHIRRIAVHVDEPDSGRFYWVLMEEGDDASQWVELESADRPTDMWIDAFQAGGAALLSYVQDERVGPRTAGDDEDASPGG